MKDHNEQGYTRNKRSGAARVGSGSATGTPERLPGPAKAELKPGGRTCQCAECGLFFTGLAAFDAHRYGAAHKRRCYTAAKMAQMGMTANENGVWSRGDYHGATEAA